MQSNTAESKGQLESLKFCLPFPFANEAVIVWPSFLLNRPSNGADVWYFIHYSFNLNDGLLHAGKKGYEGATTLLGDTFIIQLSTRKTS